MERGMLAESTLKRKGSSPNSENSSSPRVESGKSAMNLWRGTQLPSLACISEGASGWAPIQTSAAGFLGSTGIPAQAEMPS